MLNKCLEQSAYLIGTSSVFTAKRLISLTFIAVKKNKISFRVTTSPNRVVLHDPYTNRLVSY